jgi:hypothetical protein
MRFWEASVERVDPHRWSGKALIAKPLEARG